LIRTLSLPRQQHDTSRTVGRFVRIEATMLIARVSNLESFRQFMDDDDLGLGWLKDRLFGSSPSPAMKAGTAFHKALELAKYSDVRSAVDRRIHVRVRLRLRD
jgi:hypothetical protein